MLLIQTPAVSGYFTTTPCWKGLKRLEEESYIRARVVLPQGWLTALLPGYAAKIKTPSSSVSIWPAWRRPEQDSRFYCGRDK